MASLKPAPEFAAITLKPSGSEGHRTTSGMKPILFIGFVPLFYGPCFNNKRINNKRFNDKRFNDDSFNN
ncbi:hypothetical protein HZU72_02220 [Halomonas sp. QX-2]|uniref:Uncharacterized protein n=1 Tax=Vreelandella sedimenti TaxID=2729618 RepID=A0A7Z0SN79_9GAMM|nr:hypothetical protein [Halomonas sedimenti]